jgi:UDP-N-acetylglucosamine pyrophosphorylase
MQAEKLSDAAIAAFKNSYYELISGNSGMIKESSIAGVKSLPDLEIDIQGKFPADPELLQKTVVLKLNGGLGTSMGLDKVYSYLNIYYC